MSSDHAVVFQTRLTHFTLDDRHVLPVEKTYMSHIFLSVAFCNNFANNQLVFILLVSLTHEHPVIFLRKFNANVAKYLLLWILCFSTLVYIWQELETDPCHCDIHS